VGETQLQDSTEGQHNPQNGKNADARRSRRRRHIDVIALATAIGGLVAAGYAAWSVHVASEANMASEQQQLLTLTTNIGVQFAGQQAALNKAAAGLTGPQRTQALADENTGLAGQITAEGEAAQVLIGTLHGNGVADIEYIEVGRALADAGATGAALTYYQDAVTAPPRDVVTIASALRNAGALEFSLGHIRAGHQYMMRAVAVFRGHQGSVSRYDLANDMAQGYYGDAEYQYNDTPPGCAAANADMADAQRLLAPVGGVAGAESPVVDLYEVSQLEAKKHCPSSP
jgi:hypothetical protein